MGHKSERRRRRNRGKRKALEPTHKSIMRVVVGIDFGHNWTNIFLATSDTSKRGHLKLVR